LRQGLRTQLRDLQRRNVALEQQAERTAARAVLLEEAVSALPVGVLVVGSDGEVVIENGRLSSPTATMGMNLLARDGALSAASESAKTGRAVERELNLHGPPAHDFEITAQPLTGGAVVCVVTDVSERRRLAAMRRDFTINASHELRTPIGAIALLAETLEHEEDPGNIRRLASHLLREADRAQALLVGVLDLARLEGGEGERRGEVDLGWVARQAVEALSPFAESAGVDLQISSHESVFIDGIAGQLVSAVTNLVDNAVKYSTQGGVVVVTVRRDETSAAIEVSDHGTGIPSRHLDRVFERFYRVDRGRDRRTGGTGLGLAIVRHVAENHGGHVTVESRESEGSTFALVLPVPG
jgi:two-component system sensor histidine kinase SenX3